jgi:FkbM family methyltransferase
MSYAVVKAAAKHFGLYRQARWVHRHLIDRGERHRFEMECAMYRPFIRPGDLCFDVGANYGCKTEVFLALGARVVAVEPQADCYRELKSRSPSATAICAGLGSSVGTATLYIDPHRTGSSLRSTWQEAGQTQVEVPITTLDRLIEQFGVPAFCKIDVEGSELDVLKGLSHRIPFLSFEFHARDMRAALDCLDFLGEFGTFELQFTQNDIPALYLGRWLTEHEGRRFLEVDVPRSAGFAWGDVLVRFAVPSRDAHC